MIALFVVLQLIIMMFTQYNKSDSTESIAAWNGQYDHDGNAIEVNTSNDTPSTFTWRRK
jgi:hypothetical protein